MNASMHTDESEVISRVSRDNLWEVNSTLAGWERHSGTGEEREAFAYLQETLDGLAVVVKEFRGRGARRRARKSFRGGIALEVRGIPTPAPLALLRASDQHSSYAFMEAEQTSIPLHVLARRRDGAHPDPERIAAVSERVADLLVSLVEQNAHHPDLSPKNLLIQEGGDGPPRVLLVDWDGVRGGRPWSRRLLLKALVQIGDVPADRVSRSQRLRFLRRVLQRLERLHELPDLARRSQELLRRRRKH